MPWLFWFGCEPFERYAAIVLRTTHEAVYCSASVRASRKTEVAFRRRRVGMETGRSGRRSRKARSCPITQTNSRPARCAFYLFIRAESGTTARGGNSSDGPGSRISAKREATYCRDRMAPDCPIRHPVCPIVALQRRVRFSAPLARFCRIRWHQRRARRAELASFSVFVSNLDFRVPRSRQRGGAGR